MKDKKKSILIICIGHFTLFSLIIIAVFFTGRQISDSYFQRAMPIIDDVMIYEDQLMEEEYDTIPLHRIKNGSFAVFNENNALIYASSDELKNLFDSDEIRFVSDTYNETWFSVSALGMDGENGYIIVKSKYDFDNGVDKILSYCVIDKNYNVLEGDLFSDKQRLTHEEFEILANGTLSNKSNIEKATFVTNDGEQRTLAFVTPIGDAKFYQKAQRQSQIVWMIMIPFMLLLIVIETRIFVRQIKKVFYPLDEAVRTYEKSRQFNIDSRDVPRELESFVADFTELIEMINYEKNKSEAEYKEKQRVFANLSHDLRTPLTVIQGYSKAFIDGVVPEEKASQYMNAIYDRVTDAANTMDSLYEYSRLEHPDYQLDRQPDDFSEFCKEYVAEKYSDLEFEGYLLEYSIPEKSIQFSFDKTLIKRLFNNIIGNSVKYNDKGTTVYFSLEERAEYIVITLGDNGIGMPENIRDTVFKPFVIGDEARTKKMGTGLGLAIAKSVVKLHNGEIKFVNPPKAPYKTQLVIIFNK